MALLVASVSVAPARADIIVFDNFGSGDSYNVNAGSTLGAIAGHPDVASRFSIGAVTGYLSRVDVAISIVQASPSTPSPNLNDIDIFVMTDASGLPGAALEMFHFVDAMGSFGSLNSPLDAVSTLRPVLEAGQQYWIAAIVPNPSLTLASWNLNSIGDTGTGATRNNEGNWFVTSNGGGATNAFRVSVEPVPEPSAIWLFGVVALTVLRSLFRSRLQG